MERFRIPCKIPKAPPSTTKSIRFPNALVEQVEQAIQRTDCTFSAFVFGSSAVCPGTFRAGGNTTLSRLIFQVYSVRGAFSFRRISRQMVSSMVM